jgi:hypothetical protein
MSNLGKGLNIWHILLIHYNIQRDIHSNTDQNIIKENKFTKLEIMKFYFYLILCSDEAQNFEYRKKYRIMNSNYSLNSFHHNQNIQSHLNKSDLDKNQYTAKNYQINL